MKARNISTLRHRLCNHRREEIDGVGTMPSRLNRSIAQNKHAIEFALVGVIEQRSKLLALFAAFRPLSGASSVSVT
jgi:hypothetical protein